jgi:hypothetical protein
MNYAIAVLLDRLQAESAYTALEKQSFAMDRMFIVGVGFKNVEELDAIDPKLIAEKRAKLMALWLIPFGFIGGIAFSLATNLHTFAWAGEIGDRFIGGLLGAIGGAMGGLFIGGGTNFTFRGKDELSYRDRVKQGQYLVVVCGSQLAVQKATKILRECKPDNLESYIDPYTV